MAIRRSTLAASAILPVGGPAGQSTFQAWLTLPGNAGKSLLDFMAAQKGADGATQDISGLLAKTGDASVATVVAPGRPGGQTLAAWLTNPSFLATSSPLGTDAYASGRATGQAAFSFVSGDDGAVSATERYAAWIAYTGAGTGDPSVPGTAFGACISNLKKNWFNTTVPGQSVVLQLIGRGGYFGADAASTMPGNPEFGGYNPGGDMAGIIGNFVQASPYAYLAAVEFGIHYAKNGAFSPAGNLHSMNIQLGSMKQLAADGSAYNPGIGLVMTASAGNLGYAIQIQNTKRTGSYNNGVPGQWGGFFRANIDPGDSSAAYDGLLIDAAATLWLRANATALKKGIAAGANGTLQFYSDAGAVIGQLGDNGSYYMPYGAQFVIGGGVALNAAATGYGAVTGAVDKTGFDAGTALTTAQLTAKLAALWQALSNKQMIGA